MEGGGGTAVAPGDRRVVARRGGKQRCRGDRLTSLVTAALGSRALTIQPCPSANGFGSPRKRPISAHEHQRLLVDSFLPRKLPSFAAPCAFWREDKPRAAAIVLACAHTAAELSDSRAHAFIPLSGSRKLAEAELEA